MDHILYFLIRLIVQMARFTRLFSRFGIGRYDEWQPGKKLKILLAGYNGARNTGSDARVAAIVRQLRDLYGAENIQITVMTLNREALSDYFPPDTVLQEFSSIFLWDLYRACSVHHAVILCEGSALKSTFANGLTLFLCEAAGVMTSQGKPAIAYGAEIGTMEPWLQKAAVRLCRNTYFITRSEPSQQALDQLTLEGHAGTDTAWLWEPEADLTAAMEQVKQAGWDGTQPLLGAAVINPFCWPVRASLSRWLRTLLSKDHAGQYDHWYYFSDSPERRHAMRTYIDAFAMAVRRFCTEQNAFPVIIGMEKLDAEACRMLQEQLDGKAAVFLSADTDADILTGLLRQLSWLITSRYHAAVLSMPHVPVVAVSMDERLDNIMTEAGLQDHYLFHVSDPHLADNIYAALCRAAADRGAVLTRLQNEYNDGRKRLNDMGQFLQEYFNRRLS